MKNVFRKWPFSHPKHEQNGPGKKLWLDIYVEKGVWAKKSAQLVIPVRSTFQNDSHPPIGGPHPVLYFTNQIKKKYCTAMCYTFTDMESALFYSLHPISPFCMFSCSWRAFTQLCSLCPLMPFIGLPISISTFPCSGISTLLPFVFVCLHTF